MNTLSRIGRICRHIATLECEERLFGHNGEETMDEEGAQAIMELSKCEKATLVLHKRTCLHQASILPDKDSWIEGKDKLEKFA